MRNYYCVTCSGLPVLHVAGCKRYHLDIAGTLVPISGAAITITPTPTLSLKLDIIRVAALNRGVCLRPQPQWPNPVSVFALSS